MNIEELRQQIDDIDASLISLFEKRLDVAAQIALYKAEHELPILDEKREREKLSDISSRCRAGLCGEISELFSQVMRISRRYQQRVMEGADG